MSSSRAQASANPGILMTKDAILAALADLSITDLRAVHAVSGQLLGAHGGAMLDGLPLQAQLIFEALVTALGASISYASVAHTQTGKLFIKRLPDFEKFLNVNFKGWNSHKVTQLAFLRMIFTLIKDDLQKRDV